LNSQPRIGIPAPVRYPGLDVCPLTRASLQLAETREAITRAMPLIAGDFTRFETEVRGGLGL
jgi:hypothetical protein